MIQKIDQINTDSYKKVIRHTLKGLDARRRKKPKAEKNTKSQNTIKNNTEWPKRRWGGG